MVKPNKSKKRKNRKSKGFRKHARAKKNWAPCWLPRICCFLTIRSITTWLTPLTQGDFNHHSS